MIHIKEIKEEADKSKVITDYQTSKKVRLRYSKIIYIFNLVSM